MKMPASRRAFLLVALPVLGALGLEGALGADGPAAAPILVFAAASLAGALDEVDGAFSAKSGVPVKVSYAASSVLAKQIEAGAPAEVFLSADREWMDYLDSRALISRDSRRELLGNALVLIAPVGSTLKLAIAPGFDLAGALGAGRLSCADPDTVPAGRYARAALVQLGVWDRIEARLLRAENVRAALAYVARAEAPLGIVYRTDAQAEKRVRVVGTFPADTHPPITYPLALTLSARARAAQYAEFLTGQAAREIFTRYGFAVLPAGARTEI